MALVVEGFDLSRPCVAFKWFDGSINALNINGVRRNAMPALVSQEVVEACFGQQPDAMGCDMYVFSDKPVELKTRQWRGVTLYMHLTESGQQIWVPQLPVNVLQVQEDKNKEAVA